MINLEKYIPAVSKVVLLFLAGMLWLSVGVMLLFFASSWLLEADFANRSVSASAGVVLAMFVHRFGFIRIVDKNLARILPINDKRCLFSFMPWRSYLIIPIMIAMGAILRHSAIPKHYLAILYIGMGLALALSSGRYAKAFLCEIKARTSVR